MSTFQQVLNQANINTQGYFWSSIYWMLLLIVLILTMGFGFEIAIMVSFFFGTIIGIFLIYLNLMNFTVFAVTEAVLLFMVIYFIYSSRQNQ
jgi:uncharacterized membrane protein YccC